MPQEILIKGGYGGRASIRCGQLLEIINIDGAQICDFFAFNASDQTETLSPARTRVSVRRLNLLIGDKLVSNYFRSMFELVADSCGRHDMTFPPCDPTVYESRFGMKDHRSCRTNLAENVTDMNIPYGYLPEPINFFQNTPIDDTGQIEYGRSLARPADNVVLKALIDMVVVGSACPMINGVNGEKITDILFVVRDD